MEESFFTRHRLLKRFFIAITILVLIVLIAAALILIPLFTEYKEKAQEKFDSIDENTFRLTGDTNIYAQDGSIISSMGEIDYEYVSIDEISHWVYDGYIAVEDKNFKSHKGIDYQAVARAAYYYLKNRGEVTQGGSTITQQVLKNALFTNERTWDRKLTELFLAPMFEKEHTKDEIMEYYVNTNFYGNNCYGIEAASMYYFGVHAYQLDLPKAAFLVGMTKGASYYNPKTNMEEALNRQHYALRRMMEEGFITEEERQSALDTELNFIYYRPENITEKYMTSFALYSAALNLMEQEGFEFKYIFDDKDEWSEYKEKYSRRLAEVQAELRRGGYSIYTSLRPDLQEMLQSQIDEATKRYAEIGDDGKLTFQSAGVLVNNETGYVEAIVGGRGTEDEFNRGFLMKRQPGSSIKPIAVYTPAFDSGFYYPSFTLIDRPDDEDEYWPGNVTGGHVGQISLRNAIKESTNTIAYQVMKAITPMYGLRYLEKMRFSSIDPDDYYSTSVALGGFTYGVSPFEMAKAYSTLANMGEYIDNNCVIRIERQGKGVIFEEDSKKTRVYSEDASYMAIDCCKGVLQNYGRTLRNQVAFGKTGTSNERKDVWLSGATAYYTLSIWCGYDTPRKTNLQSTGLPADIWQKTMNEIHSTLNLEKKDFERPDTVVNKYIDWKGEPVSYRSGRTDLFSDILLEKAKHAEKNIGIVLTSAERAWKAENEEEDDESNIAGNSVLIAEEEAASNITEDDSNFADSSEDIIRRVIESLRFSGDSDISLESLDGISPGGEISPESPGWIVTE